MRTGLFLLLLLLGLGTFAQDKETITLEECRAYALRNNNKIKILDKNIEISDIKKKIAFTKYLPGVDLNVIYAHNQKDISLMGHDAYLPVGTINSKSEFTFRPDQIVIGANGKPVIKDGKPIPKNFAILPKDAFKMDLQNMGLAQLSVIQPIFMGGKIRAYNRIAEIGRDVTKTAKAAAEQEIIYEVDAAYWQVISLENKMNVAKKFVELLNTFKKDISLMKEMGVSTKADILSVEVKLNEAQIMMTKVENGLSLARMNLNQICGFELEKSFELSDNYNYRPEEITQTASSQALQLRPEILQLKGLSEIYKNKEKIAMSEYLPKIVLNVSRIEHYPSVYNGIEKKMGGMWTFGIGIQAPIFHWGAMYKSIKEAKANTEISKIKLEEATERIRLQIKQAEYKCDEVKKLTTMAKKNREKARENLKLAKLSYESGLAPIINVLEAQSAWLSAESSFIDAEIETKLCHTYLMKTYGILNK